MGIKYVSNNALARAVSKIRGLIGAVEARLVPASTGQAGLVKLNNTLASASTAEALTAAQGKVLSEKIKALPANPVTSPAELTAGKVLLGGGDRTVQAGNYTVAPASEPPYARFSTTGPSGANVPAVSSGRSCTLSLEARCISSGGSDPRIGPMGAGYSWDGGGYLHLTAGGGWKAATLSGITDVSSLGLFFYEAGVYDIRRIKLMDTAGNNLLNETDFWAQGEYHADTLDTPDNQLIPTLEKVRSLISELGARVVELENRSYS